jgi:hypothetical protein
MKPLVWVGARESDIADCHSLFSGSVTIFGSNVGNNRSYCSENSYRVDHNINDSVPDKYWNDELIQWIEKYPDVQFMYYNPLYSHNLFESLKYHVICRNELSLLRFLDNKAAVRKMVLNAGIDVVPYERATGRVLSTFSNSDKIVVQLNSSSGGNGTFLFSASEKNEINDLIKQNNNCFLSPYFKQSIPVNIHFFISDDSIIALPGSVQIIKEPQNQNRKLLFLGSDYIAFQYLSEEEKINIEENGYKISILLQNQGYRGIIGYDFLVRQGKILFLEANGRFQASTPVLNLTLSEHGLPCAQALNMLAYENKLPPKDIFNDFSVKYSFISYLNGTWNKSVSNVNELKFSENIIDVKLDGYNNMQPINPDAYMFKLIFNTSIVGITPEGTMLVHDNLLEKDPVFSSNIHHHDILYTKISLLNQGVWLTKNAHQIAGQIKNAVFDAIDIEIFNGLRVNCPRNVKWIDMSPWKIDINNTSGLSLYYQQTPICPVHIDKIDEFAGLETSRGVRFSAASFFATDRLRLYHGISCKFKKSGKGCRFCEMPIEATQFSLEDVFEIFDYYLRNAVGLRHFLIGGGSHDDEVRKISMLSRYIRSKTDKEIYVMCLPVEEDASLFELKNAGVNEIAFNIEIFDPEIARLIMPGKGEIPRDTYFKALEKATKYWGKEGNVRSLVIAGLEPEESFLNGIKHLCEIGVMPIVSVFRPMRGTAMESAMPPSNIWLYELYQKAQKICKSFNLYLGPSCTSCQNNTLSLPLESIVKV